MCGIAGIVDLQGERPVDPAVLERMADALFHRGPDDEGYFYQPGIGLASRRLSIIDLAEGSQPVFNEDRSVVVVYNGELFDYVEKRRDLEQRGHRFRTDCDTEILVHLWEDYGMQMLEYLHGQFAFALYDLRQRLLLLARDRVGICPLFYSLRNGTLMFASEIKGLLAAGLEPKLDLGGLDNIFTFFALPGRRTMFEGVSSIPPGFCLRIQLGNNPHIEERCYWDFDFPERGDERNPKNAQELVEELRVSINRAVGHRMRADVPVVSYLSGGVDSALIAALAARSQPGAFETFTVKFTSARHDESDKARRIADFIGCRNHFVECDHRLLCDSYIDLIRTTESPVVHVACAAVYRLAKTVHEHGYKVALSGEGADEGLGGYPWFKINKLINVLDCGPIRCSNLVRHAILKAAGSLTPLQQLLNSQNQVGGKLAPVDIYTLYSTNRYYFYHRDTLARLGDFSAWDDLVLDVDRARRWHPFNQSLYLGYKTILPGMLISQKGDRVAMAHSVETRYPFLDDEVIAFFSRLHPRWKLRGYRRDKFILRQLAEEYLPRSVARRPKAMFRAPVDTPFQQQPPRFIQQLLSEESLCKTGYFDVERVRDYWLRPGRKSWRPGWRTYLDLGLVGVIATQIWHHLFLGDELCELPTGLPSPTSALA
ncbi:MAG: asparagine synthetase B [Gemmatales bacterium]|nr:MAG: asparagine synthetase B [Gemmatales bacterium]